MEDEKTMRMRTFVLKEIYKTEKDFLDTLKFLVHVFMERLQNREDDDNDKMIPKGSVVLLLSNIEELYAFHQELYAEMEKALGSDPKYEQCIGECFVKFRDKWEVYAPYCTNHERAQKKLNELSEIQEFQGFVLGCLMLGNYVNDVSMEGFLLTPIQRICKYPLLLRELSKKTPPNHPDYKWVMEALSIMKNVCTNVNETKRQLEQLEKLEDLQNSIANWEGANLTDKCTKLIKQGALLKISAGNIQERHFFLFDHLLVYCKKANALPSRLTDVKSKGDTIRKKSKRRKPVVDQKKFIFKGRISTELMEIENLEDGSFKRHTTVQTGIEKNCRRIRRGVNEAYVTHGDYISSRVSLSVSDFHSCGYTVTNGWKILNAAKNKWFVLLAKDKDEKEAWLNEFIMERERRRSKVNMEQRDNIDVLHSKGKRLYYKVAHHGLIKDRKSKLRTYPKSMLGSDFVQYLVENKESSSVDEAVMLGQALLDCGIIHHVQDKHHFKNEAILFRFRYDDGTFKARGESQDLLAKGLRLYCRIHCLYQPLVRDKDRMLKNYKLVVEAKSLIDWLIEQGDCQSRDEVCNLGQSWCENNLLHHVLDKQDFKDDNSLFKFWPDEEHTESSSSKIRDLIKKSSNKLEFRFEKAHKTKTILLMNLDDGEQIGFEAAYVEQHEATIVTAIIRASQAHVQGLQPGQAIISINNDLLTSCTSQEQYQQILKHNLEKYKLIYLTVRAEEEIQVDIPITKEGMGFQIRSSNPCVVHAVTRGGMAMNAGLVRGQAIIRVNGRDVAKDTHDQVASAIRDGCKIDQSKPDSSPAENNNDKPQEKPTSLAVPTNAKLTRSKSDRRKMLSKKIGLKAPVEKEKHEQTTPTKQKNGQPCLQLLVGNRHLERVGVYEYDNINGVRTHVFEKMSESPSIFDLAAQLLEVLTAEDERVLADVQALENVAPLIIENRREIFERRRSLRYDVIHDRLENYKRFKRHLCSYMWPSYKEALEKPATPSAKDFCPTNCHVNVMLVSNTAEKFNLRGLGVADKHTENQATEITKQIEMIHTNTAITCMAAPSQRSRGREGHGLMAVLRGTEGNMELMDSIRQLMVALDHALIELRQSQDQLFDILNTEPRFDGKRYSIQSNRTSTISKDSNFPPTPSTPPGNTFDGDNSRRVRSGAISEHVPDVVVSKNDDETVILPSSGATLSPMMEVSEKADSGHGDDNGENKNEFPQTNPPNVNDRSADGGSVTGNDSECDSGIHSTRGSMIENEKQNNNMFNFPPPPTEEELISQGEKEHNDPSDLKEAGSSDNILMQKEDKLLHKPDLGASSQNSASAPCLASSPNAPISPVKMRPSRGRPNSRNIFSSDKDRISMISMTESTCSSDGMDSINFMDLVLSPDALDKLQGTMEHFLGKIRNLNDLVRHETVQKVFSETQDITPEVSYEKILEELAHKTEEDEIKGGLAMCEDALQFGEVINDLIEWINKQVSKVRTQLVLTVLLNEDPKLVSRRDKVFSQALIAVISSFSAQLRSALMGTFNNMKSYGVRTEDASKKWLEQATSIGTLAMFESMLNPNMPEECAMLEDSYVGVYDLERVSFHFRAITGEVEPNDYPSNLFVDYENPVHIDVNGVGYTIEGNRCALKVIFHLDKHIFIKLPPRLQAGGGVKVIPSIFNHGLEDVGELLYKQDVTMHEFINSVNEKALEKTYDYYKKFRAFHLDRSKLPRDTEARAVMIDRLSRPLNALDEVMQLMECHVKARPNRPDLSKSGAGILTLAAEFCHRLGGCHIISCNNGVQRCTTAVALEQALILARCHSLPPRFLNTAANLFKREGARFAVPLKNPKVREHAIPSSPRLFKTDILKVSDGN